jgi:hypothetical protein
VNARGWVDTAGEVTRAATGGAEGAWGCGVLLAAGGMTGATVVVVGAGGTVVVGTGRTTVVVGVVGGDVVTVVVGGVVTGVVVGGVVTGGVVTPQPAGRSTVVADVATKPSLKVAVAVRASDWPPSLAGTGKDPVSVAGLEANACVCGSSPDKVSVTVTDPPSVVDPVVSDQDTT